MITTLLIWTLITTVWVLGLTIVTQEDMGLHAVRRWAEKQGGAFFETLILCPWCMPTLHSFIGYVFLFVFHYFLIFDWRYLLIQVLVIMLSSLLSGFIWTICEILIAKTQSERYKKEILKMDLEYKQEKAFERKVLKTESNEVSKKKRWKD